MVPRLSRPASTVLLVRDGGEGIEVLLVTRDVDSGFAGGAWVFPGGKVDAADGAFADRLANGTGGEESLRAAIAGVRELWEETGVLLAHPAGSTRVLTAAEVAAASPPGTGFAELFG